MSRNGNQISVTRLSVVIGRQSLVIDSIERLEKLKVRMPMLQIEVNEYLMNPSINIIARQMQSSIGSLRLKDPQGLFDRLEAEFRVLFQRFESFRVLAPDEIEYDPVAYGNNFVSL